MGAQGLQDQVRLGRLAAHLFRQQIVRQRVVLEFGAAAGGMPLPARRGVAQVEAARLGQALLEVGEAGDGVGDQLADACVVLDQPQPVHRPLAQRRGGDAGDDRRLGAHLP
ncbi:hypothetical protein D9M71_573650 [compost metagenome]